jgi:voltage-gated potassium channel Kch
MVPFIQDGDVLTIEPTKASALDIGEVAFYRLAADRLVAHRVVGREVLDGKEILTMRRLVLMTGYWESKCWGE